LDGSVTDGFEPVVTENTNYNFSLASSGDTIILYCMTEPDSDNGTSSVQHISAITNTGGWVTNATASDDGSSVLPANLPNDTVTTLGGFPNFEYDGAQVGTVSRVRADLSDAQNWEGHEEYIANLQTKASFKIVGDPDGNGTSACFGIGRSVAVFVIAACVHVLV